MTTGVQIVRLRELRHPIRVSTACKRVRGSPGAASAPCAPQTRSSQRQPQQAAAGQRPVGPVVTTTTGSGCAGVGAGAGAGAGGAGGAATTAATAAVAGAGAGATAGSSWALGGRRGWGAIGGPWRERRTSDRLAAAHRPASRRRRLGRGSGGRTSREVPSSIQPQLPEQLSCRSSPREGGPWPAGRQQQGSEHRSTHEESAGQSSKEGRARGDTGAALLRPGGAVAGTRRMHSPGTQAVRAE